MMLTEVNALPMAQMDGKKAHQLIGKGGTPDELMKHVLVTVIRQISELEQAHGNKSPGEIARTAARERKNAPTLSEQVAARLLTVYEATIPYLVPEDARALSLYLSGVPPQVPGYIAAVMGCIGETAGEQAIELCTGRIKAKVDRMHAADRKLFDVHIKKLTGPKQRIIAGHLLDAQWMFTEGDGINSRNHLVKARELALRWLKQMSQGAS